MAAISATSGSPPMDELNLLRTKGCAYKLEKPFCPFFIAAKLKLLKAPVGVYAVKGKTRIYVPYDPKDSRNDRLMKIERVISESRWEPVLCLRKNGLNGYGLILKGPVVLPK